MRATNLTPEQIEELRDRARREAGPFVNPSIASSFSVHNAEWASEILGEPYGSSRRLLWREVYLLYIAMQAEPTPPPPPLETARRLKLQEEEEKRWKAVREAHQAKVDEWHKMRAALEGVGTKVEVRHNYTSHRHLDGFTQGVDHVYLLLPLDFGKLHRDQDAVLCWTPSRAKDLQHFPNQQEHPDDIPTCKACLKTARSIAERTASGKEEQA